MTDKTYRNCLVFGKKRFLTFFGSSFASLGLLMLLISLSTDYWITTYERMSHINITNIIAQNSGLWRKCCQSHELVGVTKTTLWTDNMKIFPTQLTKNCSFISYFKGKQKNAGEMKAPEAILYEMRMSAFFAVISLVVLLVGSILSLLSYCDENLKKSIFIASGLYVLSGIFLLIGIVLYVGCVSQAFDSKSDKSDSENIYLYEYGISFYLSVTAFILSEFAGVFSIYLYIAKQKHLLKTKMTSQLIIKTNSDDNIIKTQKFSHIGLNNILNNPSEISPLSNISQPSYQAYRRYSEQLLLKLYPNVDNNSQYSSPTRNCNTYSRTYSETRSNKDGISFIPEFRASKPSPIINYVGKKESTENIYDPSPMVIFYNDARLDASPMKDNSISDSLILNKTTYFDSPISESFSEACKPISPSNICNTCNLSFNLCNCACALLFLDKSNIRDQKIYSSINSAIPLPSSIYNNNHQYKSTSNHNNNNNNSNNNTINNTVNNNIINNNTINNLHNKSVEFENNCVLINTIKTLQKSGKQRKITAV